MKTNVYKQEQAQSLVLVALMAIVLVAFVGLAVDGGNIYAQRRVAQNAADGAAVSGAQLASDENWRFGPDPVARRLRMLQFIHRIAEVHGIPDSNNSPEDGINTNILAYYTNRDGEPYTSCSIDTCTTIPAETLGVQIFVSYAFPTYFAGVIGWDEMTVQSVATGLARVGAEGYLGNKWAVFARDTQGCAAFETDLQGAATNRVRGNVHSNGSMRFQGPLHDGYPNVRLTYVTTGGYSSSSYTGYPAAEIGLVLPEFADYYELARTQAMAGNGYLHDNLQIPPGYTRPTYLTDNTITSIGWDQGSLAPYTFIDGDLVINRTDSTNVFMGGLIAVNGNVTVQAPSIQGRSDGFTLIATGSITFAPTNIKFAGQAYRDRPPYDWSPLLSDQTNVAMVWSNADYSTVAGADPCTTPAIEFLGRGYTIQGAVLAPRGRVVLNNSSSTKLINGTLIADTVSLAGANTLLWYAPTYFPPQPDYVELIE